MHYGSFSVQWAQERRVCSAAHFDGYFRFTIGTEVLSSSELNELITKAGDPEFIVNKLQESANITRPTGGTKVAVIFAELNSHADEVDKNNIQPLLTALFQVADEIDVEGDHGKAFDIMDNELRLHWLLRRLTMDRLTLKERSNVFLAACETASLGWLARFADSAWGNYYPHEGQKAEVEAQCLTTEADAQKLRDMLRDRIADAAKDGALLNNRKLGYLLWRWLYLSNDNGAAVREWTTLQLAIDESVRKLAVAFTSHGWSHGFGDLVARRTTNAQVESLGQLMDVTRFRQRVEEVATTGQAPEVVEFLNAWQRQEQGNNEQHH